jgi:hypothetical protein
MKHQCPTCTETQALIQEWLDRQGHDRCWYYPEVFSKLAALFGLGAKKPPRLPPRAEFEEGCRRYQAEEFKPCSS